LSKIKRVDDILGGRATHEKDMASIDLPVVDDGMAYRISGEIRNLAWDRFPHPSVTLGPGGELFYGVGKGRIPLRASSRDRNAIPAHWKQNGKFGWDLVLDGEPPTFVNDLPDGDTVTVKLPKVFVTLG